MQKIKVPIAVIILVVLILSYLPPLESQAQTQQIVGGISCTVGTLVAQWLVDKIKQGISWAISNLPTGLAKFFGLDTRYIKEGVGIIDTFLNRMAEVPVGDSAIRTKEKFGDVIARCGAMAILDKISRQTVAGIRTSGRDGGPAFVRNWRNFKLDAQQRGENIFRAMLGSAELCPYISGDLRTLFKANNQPDASKISTRVNNLDPFKKRVDCTLPKNWSIKNYQTNFAQNGGWETFLTLSRPQNNFYGNLLMSLSEVSIQRAAEEESDLSSVVAGLGFDSRRGKDAPSSCLLTGSNGRCIVYKDILTPGSYLQQSASALVQQELAWLTNTDEMSELIADLTRRLLLRVLDLSGTRPSAAIIGGNPPAEQAPILETIYPDPSLPPQVQCSDGVDNDVDGEKDYPNDPECTSAIDDDEAGPSLPDSTAAITLCSDGSSAPTGANVCLTAQWFRRGQAAGADPYGACAASNCVILNHNIADGSTDANIFRDSSIIFPLLGAPDYPAGTRVDTCAGDGDTAYGLATDISKEGFNLILPIPIGGAGACITDGVGSGGGGSEPPVVI